MVLSVAIYWRETNIGWEQLSIPVSSGGWGIKDLHTFSEALRLKSFWRALFGNTLWTKVVHCKYVKIKVSHWLRTPKKMCRGVSPIWRGFLNVYKLPALDICWQVGNGKETSIGINPIVGLDDSCILSAGLRGLLNGAGYYTLDSVKNGRTGSYWYSGADLGLNGDLATEWDCYIKSLNNAGCRLNQEEDKLVWKSNESLGTVTANTAYKSIIKRKCLFPKQWWYKVIWTWKIPLKLKCFLWFVLMDRVKTWENLVKRGWMGPSRCILCSNCTETTSHIFLECPFTLIIWEKFFKAFSIGTVWGHGNFETSLKLWIKNCTEHPTLPVFISWSIWKVRNKSIFEEQSTNTDAVFLQTMSFYMPYKQLEKRTIQRKVRNFNLIIDDPVIFFDGAASMGQCAAGGKILINQDHFYTFRPRCGKGTNMKAELLALWCSVRLKNQFGFPRLKIYGDSRVTIKWAKGEYKLNISALTHWCNRIRDEIEQFRNIVLEHIYREHNQLADKMSKQALAGEDGYLFWEEYFEEIQDQGSLYFLD